MIAATSSCTHSVASPGPTPVYHDADGSLQGWSFTEATLEPVASSPRASSTNVVVPTNAVAPSPDTSCDGADTHTPTAVVLRRAKSLAPPTATAACVTAAAMQPTGNTPRDNLLAGGESAFLHRGKARSSIGASPSEACLMARGLCVDTGRASTPPARPGRCGRVSPAEQFGAAQMGARLSDVGACEREGEIDTLDVMHRGEESGAHRDRLATICMAACGETASATPAACQTPVAPTMPVASTTPTLSRRAVGASLLGGSTSVLRGSASVVPSIEHAPCSDSSTPSAQAYLPSIECGYASSPSEPSAVRGPNDEGCTSREEVDSKPTRGGKESKRRSRTSRAIASVAPLPLSPVGGAGGSEADAIAGAPIPTAWMGRGGSSRQSKDTMRFPRDQRRASAEAAALEVCDSPRSSGPAFGNGFAQLREDETRNGPGAQDAHEVLSFHHRASFAEATPAGLRRQSKAMVESSGDAPSELVAALAQARIVLGPGLRSPMAATPLARPLARSSDSDSSSLVSSRLPAPDFSSER